MFKFCPTKGLKNFSINRQDLA
uniref:Uncharacterized protein n=1 Tax=Romanomermis culicivorax TaxID=13658 RepID=A0A915KQJ8_ROMCU